MRKKVNEATAFYAVRVNEPLLVVNVIRHLQGFTNTPFDVEHKLTFLL